MAEPTILRGSDHFFVTTYEGNGGGQKVGNFVPFTDNGTISNSVIFNYDEAHILEKTFGSAGTSRKKYTFSVWCKLGRKLGSEERRIIMVGPVGNDDGFRLDDDNTIHIWQNGISASRLYTNRTFEDTSKWYHFVLAVDTTQSTASNRIKFYVDGEQITSFSTEVYPSQDYEGNIGNNKEHTWGAASDDREPYDGYLAEVNYVDGTAYGPDTFGVTDTSTGRWIPKNLTGISYGSHGYRLKFQDSSALGDDTSGNGNDFSASNFASGDYTTDSPTQNFATMSPPFSGSIGFDEGNLKVSATASNDWETAYVGKNVNSGKWYFEVTATTVPSFFIIGLTTLSGYVNAKNTYIGDNAGSHGMQFYPGYNDTVYYNGSNFSYGSGSSLSNGNVIGVAYDADLGAYWLAVNNTWVQSGNPSNGTNPVLVAANAAKQDIYFGISTYNGGVFDFNFGQKSLSYTPPTDFKLLQQDNFPDEGVKPDIVWIKNRDATDNNQWYDSSRGPLNRLKTNSTDGEDVVNDGLQKFLKGGAAIEDDNELNTSGESYVSWNWVVGGGTTSANTDGVGATVACTIQKNTTAGISIVEWTGGGSAGTIEHGLGKVPQWMMYKRKNADGDGWIIYHHRLGSGSPEDGHISLQTTHTFSNDATMWNDTAPTTQLATIGTYGMQNTEKRVGYFFTEIRGFSKFGEFLGNANSDGPFVYLGFKPKFILFKAQTSAHWAIHDSTRDKNQNNQVLYSSLTSAEGSNSGRGLDFLSNGFKIRQESGYNLNYSNTQTVYFAFAEHPFAGTSSINPATAN